MKKKYILWLCIFFNYVNLGMYIVVLVVCATDNTYWTMLWNSTLMVINVHINTPVKYFGLLFLITVTSIRSVIVKDLGIPIIEFNVYNPINNEIYGFSKIAIQMAAIQMFYLMQSLSIINWIILFSQIDLALYTLVVETMTSFIALHYILKKKTFYPNLEERSPLSEQDEYINDMKGI